MRAVNFTEARGHFKQVLDEVIGDHAATLIKRRDREDAVVMSISDYNSLMETLYLLSSRKNTNRLLSAMDRADAAFPDARVLAPATPRASTVLEKRGACQPARASRKASTKVGGKRK